MCTQIKKNIMPIPPSYLEPCRIIRKKRRKKTTTTNKHLGLAKAGLISGVVLFLSGFSNGILLLLYAEGI